MFKSNFIIVVVGISIQIKVLRFQLRVLSSIPSESTREKDRSFGVQYSLVIHFMSLREKKQGTKLKVIFTRLGNQ